MDNSINRIVCSLHQSNGRCVTSKYFQVLGNIHDIESYIDNTLSLNVQIFISHWGHLSIIILWITGNLFHIGWSGNYELWIRNPIATIPISHGIMDPHFGVSISDAYSCGNSDYTVVLSYSGIYNWLYASGFVTVFQVYNFVISCELLAVFSISLAKIHLINLEDILLWTRWYSFRMIGLTINLELEIMQEYLHMKLALDITICHFEWPLQLFVSYFDLSGLRLNYHVGILIGFLSIAWSGHLVHVAIPIWRGYNIAMTNTIYTNWHTNLKQFYTANWIEYSFDIDNQAILTFIGGLKLNSVSLYPTDITHHHLAIGILSVWARHLYLSLYRGIGVHIRDILFVNGNSGSMITSLGKSVHIQLSLALAGISVITSLVAQHIYSLTPYLYLSYDYMILVALYVHHSWIASLLMIGSFVHSSIFLIRDYTINIWEQDVTCRILAHKGSIISHLSWLCLLLGFHTLGVYIHNDTVVAFGEQDKQILIEPVFGQIVQGSIQYNWQSFDLFLIPIGRSDLLAHHAIALGLHVTILILLKGSLDGCGSKLMPDKIHFGYGFSCDGPGRAGTCDISSWDAFYLAAFWMLNTSAWTIFYFHWKHITLNTVFQFDESASYLNGWFRDYLWFNSGPLIQGYNTLGANDLSIWAWSFLAAHLCWATGFMFLISWRGYWQELIDIILYMHLKTPILYDLWNGNIYTPVALSIVQARFVGLIHFAAGFILTYSSFIIGSSS